MRWRSSRPAAMATPLSSGRPRLGRQHRLVAGRSLSAAAGVAHGAVAAASERLQSRAANARWRSGAPLAASQGVSRTRCGRSWCWPTMPRWLRERLAANGVPAAAIERHLAVLGNKAAMEAALAWYRARGAIRGPLGPIRVPTLYIWGDADDTVGRDGRRGHARISSPRPIASKCCPASAISRPTRRPIASANCCCSTSRPIRSDGPIRKLAELRRLENVVLQQMEHDDMANENHQDNARRPSATSSRIALAGAAIPPAVLNDGPELLRSSHC